MGNKKATYSDFIEGKDLNDNPITAVRHIEGTRTLFQTIQYEGKEKKDPHAYKPAERAHMDGMARQILSEIVKGFL